MFKASLKETSTRCLLACFVLLHTNAQISGLLLRHKLSLFAVSALRPLQTATSLSKVILELKLFNNSVELSRL